jgi:hypothetical protein
MIPTSDGSQPKQQPSRPVSDFVAEFIRKLQDERQPSPGEEAMKGAIGQSIKDNSQYYA